jgi:hypothetical protein
MRLRRRDHRPGPDRLVATGLAATLILVLAGAAAQLADHGFGLGTGQLDSSTDGGVFGVVGDVALASAALAAWGALMAFGLMLLGAAFVLHFTGETVLDKLHASHGGWPAELKAVLKHGAELAGWLIVTLALVVGVRELPDGDTRGRRGRRALAKFGPTAVDRSPTM